MWRNVAARAGGGGGIPPREHKLEGNSGNGEAGRPDVCEQQQGWWMYRWERFDDIIEGFRFAELPFVVIVARRGTRGVLFDSPFFKDPGNPAEDDATGCRKARAKRRRHPNSKTRGIVQLVWAGIGNKPRADYGRDPCALGFDLALKTGIGRSTEE